MANETIQVACPKCGTITRAPVEHLGKRGRCACGEVFVLSQPEPKFSVTYTPANPKSESPRPKVAVGKYCSTCGEGIHVNAEICPHCGVRQASVSTGGKTLLPALLLHIFLGWIGIHSFYCGRGVKGAIYVILFVLGLVFPLFWFVSFVIWCVDLVYLVSGNLKDGSGNKITRWVS